MKNDKSKEKLKIDPKVNPIHQKKLFSTLNYLEAGVVVLGIVILIFILANNSDKAQNNDLILDMQSQKEILDKLHKETPALSEEEQRQQINNLNDLRKEVSPLSLEERQSQINVLDSLRK